MNKTLRINLRHSTGHISNWSIKIKNANLRTMLINKVDDLPIGKNILRIYDGRKKVYQKSFSDDKKIIFQGIYNTIYNYNE